MYSITHFIVTNYGPNWFNIKCDPSCIDGPKHVYLATQRAKHLSPAVVGVIKPYIARNAYFAHPENVLVAMMADTDVCKRVKAITVILRIRNEQCAVVKKGVRQFKVPELSFDATDWDEMIRWDDIAITEPPLTRNLTNEQLEMIKEEPLVVKKYPNHTQSVERSIKLITDALKQSTGLMPETTS